MAKPPADIRSGYDLIAVLEKDLLGRWHFHAAIEPPAHLSPEQFDKEIRCCWAKTHWAYREVMVRDNADPGWLKYMFKQRQKSGLEHWSDYRLGHVS